MSMSKSSSNSNKTAHVMNLLRKNTSPAPAAQDDMPAPAAAPSGPVSPLLSSLHTDAAISASIKSALESELEEAASDVPNAAPAEPAHEAGVAEAGPSSSDTAGQDTIPAPAADTVESPCISPEAPADGEKAHTPSASVAARAPGNPELINVMQHLVEKRADDYISLFGLCPCERCRSDVIALTLNAVAPKYIVMPREALAPLLDMYQARYNGEIIAHLLHACKVVAENPRHDTD